MKRLTTETPEGNTGQMLNMTKVIDKEVYLRDITGEGDISLVDYCRAEHKRIYKTEIEETDPTEFGGYMDDDSLLSMFYWMAVGHAELRLRLMAYEDTGLSPKEVQSQLQDIDKLKEALQQVKYDFEQGEISGKDYSWISKLLREVGG